MNRLSLKGSSHLDEEGEAAGQPFDPLRHRLIRQLAKAGGLNQAGVEVEKEHLLFSQIINREGDVGVDDLVGGNRADPELPAGNDLQSMVVRPDLFRQILQPEEGDLLQILRAVPLLLEGGKALVLLDDLLHPVSARLFSGVERPLGDRFVLAPLMLFIRLHRDKDPMGVVKEVILDPILEIPGVPLDPFFQLVEGRNQLDRLRGRPVDHPRPGGSGQCPEAGGNTAGNLQLAEAGALQRRFDELGIETVPDDLFQRGKNDVLRLFTVFRVDPLEAGDEGHLPELGAHPALGRDVRGEIRIDDRFVKRGGGVAKEDVHQRGKGHHRERIVVLRGRPGKNDRGVLHLFSAFFHRAGEGDRPLAVPPPGKRNDRVDLKHSPRPEVVLIQIRQLFSDLHPAEEKELRIGGVVILIVERAELLIGEVDDRFGIASGFEGVGVVGKERLHRRPADDRIMVGADAQHLVEDNPFVVAPLLVTDEAHPLPPERLLPEQGGEDRIGVDGKKIVEVLLQGTGGRVYGPVGIGEGVHEGIGAAFEQRHEGIVHRIALRSRQKAVLNDVGYAGIIAGKGSKKIAEEAFGVFVDHLVDFHLCFNMSKEVPGSLIFRQGGDLFQNESVKLVACGELSFSHG